MTGANRAIRKAQTTYSTKGQVVLPAAIRADLGWKPGVKLTVERSGDGVTIRPAKAFPETPIGAAFGIFKRSGPPLPIEMLGFNEDVDDYDCG